MFKTPMTLVAGLLITVLLASCGGESAPSATATADSSATSTTTATPTLPATVTVQATAERAPADIGRDILAVYERMLTDVTALLVDEPTPSALRDPLLALKDGYIEQFVGLGWERWALDAAGRASADSAAAILQIDPARIEPLSAAVARFHALGTEEGLTMGNELASFNILSQYAFFEILRRQLPEEADRLGVP